LILSEKLKALRKDKGLTVAKLAEISGVSQPYIWQLESKMKLNPSSDMLQKLATALGTTVSELIGASITISEDALKEVPPSLRKLAKEKGDEIDLRQEDIEMLRNINYRGKRPNKSEDWELIFLFLKRILG
jgi:transcriptional regulator with XRE-family HTH domain